MASEPQFECDLEPETGMPRVRFNFDNGWSASLLVRTGANLTDAMLASVACCPTGQWGAGVTELGPTEAWADEAISWIARVRARGSGTGDQVCQECGGPNPVWFAPNELWNRVMGGPDATGDPGGVLCPACFIAKAEEHGQCPTAWVLTPETAA